MSKLQGSAEDRAGGYFLFGCFAFFLVIVILLFALAVEPRDADAATVTAEIGHGFSNAVGAEALDPTFNKPIDYTPMTFSFSQTSGWATWGSLVELAQNGRAGVVADRVSGNVSHPFRVGPVVVAPQLQIGYSRAPNMDFGLVGGELRATIPMPILRALSTELAVRERHSFAVNFFANEKGSGLPETRWTETRFEAAEVWQISPKVAVGLHGDIDRGSNPDKVLGVFTQLSF